MTPQTGISLAAGPHQLLVNDEGNSLLHHFDLDAPERNWVYCGAGRDLQLVGRHRLLRSAPGGYVELDLAAGGALVKEVVLNDLPGGVESARRLTTGHTIVAGNAASGIFVWELDEGDEPVTGRQQLFAGIEKVRMVRLTRAGTFLFCSETAGRSVIHEMDWSAGVRTLFLVPDDVPADSMVKAVRVSPSVVVVSTGYAASLLRIDTRQQKVLQRIGGKDQPDPADIPGNRALSPFFFSGYQSLANGHYLVSNWQGHSAEKNGQGYQLLQYDPAGRLVWAFDQVAHPGVSSLNNVLALDGLDTSLLHDELEGVQAPLGHQ